MSMIQKRLTVLAITLILLSGCLENFADGEIDSDESVSIITDESPTCHVHLFSYSNGSGPNEKIDVCLNRGGDLNSLLNPYRSIAVGNGQPDLNDATRNPQKYGLNISSWQLDNGGWGKVGFEKYMSPWDGEEPRSAYLCNHDSCVESELSTFDNNATTAEMRFLAQLFSQSPSEENRSVFKNSFEKGLSFILDSQNETGAWPQVYPKRFGSGEYSNLGTYNDHVIVRNMVLLLDLVSPNSSFDESLIIDIDRDKIVDALARGLEFILKTQIVVDGELTIWSQQYDMSDYSPSGARSFELTGRSTWESVGITSLLLNWPNQDTEVEQAVLGAIGWFKDNAIQNMKYVYNLPNQEGNGEIIPQENEVMWYRLYNISDDQFFMSLRDGVKIYDINEMDDERRYGYQWGGDWGRTIIDNISINFS
tara:strand:- start:94 stop:1359 length:1266 start_codon:yes stop_codon:yes gene_type:complete